MAQPDPAAYGRVFADVYDDWYGEITDVDSTVGVLAELAAGGRILELGVGTGRIAIPLSAVAEVHGVDTSPEMLALLGSKTGSSGVQARLGDMADPLGGPFQLVFAAFNTFFNLPDDESQQRCLAAVAAALEQGGLFVVEAVVPTPTDDNRHHHDETMRDDGGGGTIRTLTTHVPNAQLIHGVHIHTRSDGTSVDRAWRVHYQLPRQLDAMCAAADLELRARWADWDRSSWIDQDTKHVSVYVKSG